MRDGDENSGGTQGVAARRPVRARLRLVGRALFAGLFLPLTLVAAGPAAPGHAASGESEWVDDVSWSFDLSFRPDVWCWAPMKFDEGASVVTIAPGKCKSGGDTTPGFAQWGEPGTGYRFWAEGPGCNEPSDGYELTGTTTSHPDDSMSDIASTIGGGIFAVGTCSGGPEQICMEIKDPGSETLAGPVCKAVDFPSAVERGGDCPYGVPIRAKWTATQDTSGTYAGYWRARGSATWVGADGLTWSKKPVVRQTNGAITHSWVWTEYNLTVPPGGVLNPWAGDPSFNSPSGGGAELLGVQVSKADLTDPQFDLYAGFTKPENCVFYFGTKFRSTSLDDSDEPMGPNGDGGGGTAPPTAPPGEGTDDTVKPTDDVGWLEALWSLLRDLIAAIGDLVGAIGGLLMDLLIPSPGSWGLDGLKAQLDAKPPFSLIGSAGEATSGFVGSFSGAGNCGVLANFDVPVGDGSISCSAVRDAPGLNALYTLVQAGLVALTGWALFRMVSGYFQDGQ